MKLSSWRIIVKLLCLSALTLPLLTGCWDRSEIEERAVILGIAVDEATPEERSQESQVTHLNGIFPSPDKNMIKITAQIAVPGRIPLGPGEGTGGSSSGRKPVWVLSSVGHTIDDAMMVLQQQLADRMFFGHLRVIVISEAIARKGVQNLNDFFRRSPEVRRLAWMLVSKGPAAELIKAGPQLERVPALYLMAMMDHAVAMGKFPNDFIGIFWSADSSKGREPYLPYVEIKRKENVEISGIAYFKHDKMVGSTQPLEIGFFMGITGVKSGGYNAFVPIDSSEMAMFRATYRKSIIEPSIKQGRPHVTVKTMIEGNIEEKSSELYKVKTHSIIKEIEGKLSKQANDGYMELIKKTQMKGSDIFGFGEYFRAKQPRFWNEQIKNKNSWENMYKELTVEVDTKIKIRRVGMKKQ